MISALFNAVSPHRSIAIFGMCKNAGKTTALNALISAFYRRSVPFGLTSIGYDGEDTDLVTSTSKPSIYIPEGTVFATAEQLLARCDVTREILQVFGIATPLGRVVLARAKSAGQVLLAGPSHAVQLRPVMERFMHFGAQKVLIDGALNRRAFVASDLFDAAVLCTGASCQTGMDAVVDDTLYILSILSLSVFDHPLPPVPEGVKMLALDEAFLPVGEGGAPRHLLLSGALLDSGVEAILRLKKRGSPLSVICEDAGKVLLSQKSAQKLRALKVELFTQKRTNLVAVCLNPKSAYGFDLDPLALRDRLRMHTDLPLINVLEDADEPF